MRKGKFLFLGVFCIVLLNFSDTGTAQQHSSTHDQAYNVAFFIPEFDQSFLEKYRKLNKQSSKDAKKGNNSDIKLKYLTETAKL